MGNFCIRCGADGATVLLETMGTEYVHCYATDCVAALRARAEAAEARVEELHDALLDALTCCQHSGINKCDVDRYRRALAAANGEE